MTADRLSASPGVDAGIVHLGAAVAPAHGSDEEGDHRGAIGISQLFIHKQGASTVTYVEVKKMSNNSQLLIYILKCARVWKFRTKISNIVQ